MPPNGIKQMK